MSGLAPTRSHRHTRWGSEQRTHEHELLARLSTLDAEEPERRQIRDELVVMHLPLVEHLAHRYRDRGESVDDLVQVGTIGLIKAIDNFDVDRGAELSTYATPTILGEIKRHFRDHAWALHMPRRMQELQSQVAVATDALTFELGRSPTVREIADRVGITVADVLDVIEARQAYSAAPLEAPSGPENRQLSDILGTEDPALHIVEDRESLLPMLRSLPDRERQIVVLRFYHGLSQSQIAERMGISQMHVSRLLAKSLAEIRAGLSAA